MIRQNDTSRGWISAEYSLLPYSTQERKPRDRGQGKTDGRVVEIQRLVGRSLRAVADLPLIKGRTLWIDCDVLQADGGTRTASINGAYLAAQLAVRKRLGQLFMGPVAAISVGMVAGEPVLDLNYEEDRQADVDFNVVMDDRDRFIEIQGTAEGNPFSQKNLEDMLELARKGIREIMDHQKTFLETVD
jgi:ribonuclease PH